MASDDTVSVPIRDESIRLGQLLKLANLAEDGLEARHLVEDGAVTVNGTVETRRGRQLVPGDTVTTAAGTVTITGPGGS